MWALLLQVLAVAAGWQVVRRLPVTWHRLEALAASVAVGFAVAPWLYFLAALTLGWPVGLPAASGLLLVGTVVSWWRLPRRAVLTSAPYVRNGWRRWLSGLTAAGVVYAVAHLVFLSYQFPAANGSWMSNGNVWGDAPLHVALATQFSQGPELDLVSPVYRRVALTYPLIGDLWSGVLMRLTPSWFIGLTLPSLVIMLALLQLLFSFAHRLLGSARGAWLAWLMLVFSGSFQGAVKTGSILLTQGYGAFQTALGSFSALTTRDNYLNFLHSHPLPQRAYSFGMPLAIVVAVVALELYRRRHDAHERKQLGVAAGLAGGLLGLMPLVHTHSFMVMAGALALATVALWWFEHKLPAGWWRMLAIGAVLAAPQLAWQFATTYHGGFSHWTWGWMMADFAPVQRNWFVYWFNNLGWLFVMILLGWAWLARARVKAEVWLVYAAGVLIFAICNVYVFQPSMWDNMKFFEYGFWMVMLAAAAVLAHWSRRWWGKLVTAGLMVSLCLTGFLMLAVAGPGMSYELLSAEEVRFGNLMRDRLPADAYILVSDRHNSPITMLANRKVLMTFGGWYNLYGADWPTTYANRGIMLTGGAGATDLIKFYGVNMAAFSDYQVYNGEVSLTFFQEHYDVFYHGEGWWVFDLRNPRDNSGLK